MQGIDKANLIVCVVSVLVFFLVIVGYGANHSTSETTTTPTTTHSMTAEQAKAALTKQTDEYWAWQLEQYPEYATISKTSKPPKKVTDYSLEAIAKRNADEVAMLNSALLVEEDLLEEEDRITLEMLREELNTSINSYNYKEYFLFMNQLQGPQLEIPDFVTYMSLSNEADAEAYVSWLALVPGQVAQWATLLTEAVKANVVFPTVILGAVQGQLDHLCCFPDTVTTSPLLEPLNAFASEPWYNSTYRRASQLVFNDIKASFRNLSNVWQQEYLPHTSSNIASSLRMQSGFYSFAIRRGTTLDVDAQTLHNLGLSEVNKTLTEMQKVKVQMGMANKTLQEVNDYLRASPEFYYTTEAAYLEATRAICKKADAALPQLFSTLPRCPYGVLPISESAAPSGPAAFYLEPNAGCNRAGLYMVNTYNLAARPSYTMESTALHEAVPGHHLQNTLALELSDLPELRRNAGLTAYNEGWALYAETLGTSMGLFADPFSLYGHLANSVFRACRLVVDTGMHALGWTREQSIEYMLNNSPLSAQDVRAEVNRYIAWPGQALAYKSGALTILQLKKAAQQKLGANFDIRAFHAAVLRHGSIPLSILKTVVGEELGFSTEGLILGS